MAGGYCNDCKWLTPIVIDHKARDVICSACGSVLEHFTDEKPEWLNFCGDDDSMDQCNDPRAVGSPENPFPYLVSRVKNTGNSTNSDSSGGSGCSHGVKGENSIEYAHSSIESMGKKLRLTTEVKDYAKELFNIAREENLCRFKNVNAIISACVCLACRELNEPRTVNETASVTGGITRRKQIHQAILTLQKKFGVGKIAPQPKDLALRFCSKLDLDDVVTEAVLDTIDKCEEHDIRRNCSSILGAAVFMVSQLSETKKTCKDIAGLIDVSPISLKEAYKDLYAIASEVIPTWYAKPEDLKKLCAPRHAA